MEKVMNEPVPWLDQPTAERTPALLFPLLTAQTTGDELCTVRVQWFGMKIPLFGT